MSSKRESAMRKSSAILVRLGEESWEVEGNALSATRRVEQSERLTVQPRTKAPITLQSMRERIETTRSVQDTRAKFSAIASEPARPTAEPAPSETTKLAFYQKAWAYIVDLIAPSGAKSAASTLRGGLLVGMIFGCLSLLLFHQMLRINPMTQSELVSAKRTVSVPVWNQPTRSKPLSLPGVQIALLESGPFSSVDARNRAISSLAKEGIDGIVSSRRQTRFFGLPACRRARWPGSCPSSKPRAFRRLRKSSRSRREPCLCLRRRTIKASIARRTGYRQPWLLCSGSQHGCRTTAV